MAGMNDYISKPIDQDTIATVLLKWLGDAPAEDIAAAVDGSSSPDSSRGDDQGR